MYKLIENIEVLISINDDRRQVIVLDANYPNLTFHTDNIQWGLRKIITTHLMIKTDYNDKTGQCDVVGVKFPINVLKQLITK